MTDIDVQEISEVAEDYLKANWGPAAARELPGLDDDGFLAKWRQLSGLGWGGLFAPEHLGGLDLPATHMVAVFEKIGAHLLPGLSLDFLVGVPDILSRGSTESEDVLRCHVQGELIVIVAPDWVNSNGAFSEDPWDGVSLANGKVVGERRLIDFAHLADCFIVTARERNEPVVVLSTRNPHAERSRLASIDVCAAPANVSFPGVPVLEVIARGDDAVDLWSTHMTTKRIAVSAEVLGVSKALLAMALEYAPQRVAFGSPISDFQAIRHMLAQMQTDLHGLDAIIKSAARAVAAHEPEAYDLAMSAKVRASRVARAVREASLQVHGGIGFTDEHDLHLYFKRSMTLESTGGDERALKRMRGSRALESAVPREAAGEVG